MDYREKIDVLPAHMRGAMLRYIEHGLAGGSFLSAVLCNDLMDALGRADTINRHSLPAYGEYLFNYAPSGCHGSREKVDAWIEGGGLVGMGKIVSTDAVG